MLAKPEYSSPPDEVCCWPGRRGRATAERQSRGRAAGRGAAAELMAGSAMAKRIAALWQRAIWKMLLAGALQRRAIGKMLLAGALRRSCCRQGTVGTGDCQPVRCGEELSGRCCWPGRRSGIDTTGQERRSRAAGRQPQEGITTQKKRVTPKPSWTCGSPSCLLTNC